jgi:uncharacterized protein (DUF3084 family)
MAILITLLTTTVVSILYIGIIFLWLSRTKKKELLVLDELMKEIHILREEVNNLKNNNT